MVALISLLLLGITPSLILSLCNYNQEVVVLCMNPISDFVVIRILIEHWYCGVFYHG